MTYSKIKILDKNKKKEIENLLNEQFGIKEINGIILMRGRERLFLFQGDLAEEGIKKFEESVLIERLGVYFAKVIENKKTNRKEIRLSIEGTHLFKGQITKNIFEIPNMEILEKWMKGNEIEIETGKRGFLIMNFKEDFLGCGKASEKKISNFIPKNRRLKEKRIY